MAEFTGLFPNAKLVVQPGAGHFPWLDDADRFVATTAAFLVSFDNQLSPHQSADLGGLTSMSKDGGGGT